MVHPPLPIVAVEMVRQRNRKNVVRVDTAVDCMPSPYRALVGSKAAVDPFIFFVLKTIELNVSNSCYNGIHYHYV
jgi:hypothetical protein